MMKHSLLIYVLVLTPFAFVSADNSVLNQLTAGYRAEGATAADAKKGQQLWNKTFAGQAPYTERSCSSCHTDKLKNKGKHVRTGKLLQPLAPSVNKNSLTKIKQVEKWLKRNCKWTLSRECSAQEKTDLLTYISQQ